MKLETLYAALTTTGLPVGYRVVAPGTEAPYLVYMEAYARPVAADDAAQCEIVHYQAELYITRKDTALEQKVEAALAHIGIVIGDKTEDSIESEHLLRVIYEFEELGE